MKKQNAENPFSGMTREEIIQEAKKQILHSAVLALAALIVIGVACYAWFVGNNAVTAIISGVSMNTGGFELASQGDAQIHSVELPTDYTLPEGEDYTFTDSEGVSSQWKATGGIGKQVVQWQMSDSSNFGNLSHGEGLHPGSEGELTFYVIPRENGVLKLRFSMEIVPLKLTDNLFRKMQEIDNNSPEAKLLRGHLLFAYTTKGEDEKDVEQLANYEDGGFELDFGTVREGDAPIPVTLRWFWPKLMKSVTESEQHGDQVKSWMLAKPSDFFYDEGKEITVGEVTSDNVTLNKYYNNADKYIGDNVTAIILRMNAVKVN